MILNVPSERQPGLQQHADQQLGELSAAARTRPDLVEDNIFGGSTWTTGTSADNIFSGAGPHRPRTMARLHQHPAEFVDPALLNFQLAVRLAGGERRHGDSRLHQRLRRSGPDIGCFEYGLTPWTAGASAATNVYAAAIPATPVDLTATSPATAEIDLTWQNNDANATSCVVERSTDGWTWRSRRSSTCRATPLPTPTRRCSQRATITASASTTVLRFGLLELRQRQQRPGVVRHHDPAASFTAASGVTASGGVLTNCNVGNWAEYANVAFPAGVNSAALDTAINQITVCYSSTAAGDNSIEFFANGLSGHAAGLGHDAVRPQRRPLHDHHRHRRSHCRREHHGREPQRLRRFRRSRNGKAQNVAKIDWFEFSSVAVPGLELTTAADYTNTGGTSGGVQKPGRHHR